MLFLIYYQNTLLFFILNRIELGRGRGLQFDLAHFKL